MGRLTSTDADQDVTLDLHLNQDVESIPVSKGAIWVRLYRLVIARVLMVRHRTCTKALLVYLCNDLKNWVQYFICITNE